MSAQSKKAICFYFQVHQPFRLKRYRFFDLGNDHYYYDDYTNESIMRKVAEKCYLPANKIILELIQKHKGKFKVTFSNSGFMPLKYLKASKSLQRQEWLNFWPRQILIHLFH
jgi:alpha-amylase/alpha-mannosidase (GH57 family)